MKTSMRRKIDTRIKELLAERGMTGKELAKVLGVTPQYVSSIVNGGRSVSLNALISVADALNVPLSELIVDRKAAICPHCGKEIRLTM